MNDNPLVTVYITCYNYNQYLKKSIISVLDQEYTNWELFIIDDGSDENAEDIVSNFIQKFPSKISFIRNEKPLGLQKNANYILSIANGEYIIRLDADDWFDVSALLLLVNKAKKDENVGLVFGGYYYVNEDGHIIGIEQQPKSLDNKKTETIPAHGACTLIKTRPFKAVGGYSEDLDAQDGWDLWFKLINRVKSASISTPIFYYRQHSHSLSTNKNRLYNAREKIFSNLRNNISKSFESNKVAIIPVKESYPHLKNIPFTKINKNKSLLEYTILQAEESNVFNEIIITTESERVITYVEELISSKKIRPVTLFLRKVKKNINPILVEEIIKEAIVFYQSIGNKKPDIVAYLNLHAPLRTSNNIKHVVDALLVTDMDSVVTVVEERNPIFKNSQLGLNLIGSGKYDGLFHREEQILKFNGQVIASWWDIVDKGSIWGGNVGYVEMPYDSELQIRDEDSLTQIIDKISKKNE